MTEPTLALNISRTPRPFLFLLGPNLSYSTSCIQWCRVCSEMKDLCPDKRQTLKEYQIPFHCTRATVEIQNVVSWRAQIWKTRPRLCGMYTDEWKWQEGDKFLIDFAGLFPKVSDACKWRRIVPSPHFKTANRSSKQLSGPSQSIPERYKSKIKPFPKYQSAQRAGNREIPRRVWVPLNLVSWCSGVVFGR